MLVHEDARAEIDHRIVWDHSARNWQRILLFNFYSAGGKTRSAPGHMSDVNAHCVYPVCEEITRYYATVSDVCFAASHASRSQSQPRFYNININNLW
jgi:hypothetical protein